MDERHKGCAELGANQSKASRTSTKKVEEDMEVEEAGAEEMEFILPHNPYKVKVPQEKRVGILQDLVLAYQAKFGDQWSTNLTKNLTPSPIKGIAEKHHVSANVVRSLKHTLWQLGMILGAAAPAAETIEL
jgi:hypothetical protein